jgi:hypothetical protein
MIEQKIKTRNIHEMTVAELIEQLKKYPGNMVVGVFNKHGYPPIYSVELAEINEDCPNQFTAVIIEPNLEDDLGNCI